MNREQRRAAAQEVAKQANEVAKAASEAGRVLQQRQQEVKAEPEAPKVDAPRPAPTKLARHDIEDEISARSDERTKEALEKRAKEEQAEQEPQQEAAPPATEAPPEPQAEVAPEPEAPKTVKVKIYGEEKEVLESEVEEYGGVKGYQIAMAAKRDREELKAQQEQTRQLVAHLLQQQQPQKPQQTNEQQIAALVDIERFGTPEESAAAKIKINQLLNKPQDEAQIIMKATANFKHDTAQQRFNSEFADVLTSPEIKQFAALLNQQQLSQYVVNGETNWQALATVDFDNHYRTIGNRIRNMFGGKTQAASVPQTGKTSQSDKEAKKASIVNLPTASQRASLPQEEKPQTREQILREERKARGLPVSG